MFIKAFNNIAKLKLEGRSQAIIKAEMCKTLLKFFAPVDEDEINEIITNTINGLAELLRANGKSVKKLHVVIINNSLNDSYNAYRERRKTGFGSMSELPKLTDRIFQTISDVAKVNMSCYSRADYESIAGSVGMIMAMLDEAKERL